MTSSPLTQCPRCEAPIGFGGVTGVAPIDDTMCAVGLICLICGQGCHLKIQQLEWTRLVEAVKAGQKPPQRATSPVGGGGSMDARELGRVVKGFAEVELSLPDLCVDDLVARWDYQSKTDWGSVPKEF